MQPNEHKHPMLTTVAILASPALMAGLLALPASARAEPPLSDPYGREMDTETEEGLSIGEPVRLPEAEPESPAEAERDWERAAPAMAEPEEGGDPHAPLDDESLAAWDHFEFSMGFVGGYRRFDRMAFEGDPTIDPSLYRTEPLDGVQAYGLRYDVRLVVAYTRMTVGIDFPFTQYTVADTVRTLPDGSQSTVARVKPFAFRFGIGGEIPIGPVAPFVDILGSIHSVRATFDIDDVEREVKARSFGFSARAGLRLHVRKWFFASLAGEVGIVGPTVWAAELSVGFAVM
jgi:hypothetical protein